jgi:hypothetical protein
LYDERDDIAGAEDPEVEFGAKNGRAVAEQADEAAEQDVDAGSEKGRCY